MSLKPRRKKGKRHIKKSNDHLQQDIEIKYQFIKDHRSEFTMKKMCQVLKISMSGFYHWIKRSPTNLGG